MKTFLLSLPLLCSFIFVLLIAQTCKVFSQSVLPVPDHIVIVILENRGYTQIIGSAAAPHINALATDPYSALFTQSYAIEHPSQPNYLDLYSGCNQGVTHDHFPATNPFTTANLGRQLIDNGRTYTTYSEDLPSVGFNGTSSDKYVRRHNPAANWMGTGTNQIPVTTNQPFTAFPSTDFNLLPTVCYVIPNKIHDMHDSTIAIGDTWVYDNLNNYIEWSKSHNSLFILTFDEDNGSQGNHIVTIFSGEMVLAGQYSDTINHYTVLRTIEDMYGLPYACNAATATPISGCWDVDTDCTITINPSSATICKGKTVSLTATGALSYSWSPANGLNCTTCATVSAKPNATTVYTVTGDGGACSATVGVTVNLKPGAGISAGTCSGGAVLLTRTGTPATGVTFKWFKNNVKIGGATNATYSATTSGQYKVRVTNTSTGCTQTSPVLQVDINCRVGKQITGIDVSAYPNPFTKSIRVNFASTSSEQASVVLLDFSGRMIRRYGKVDVTGPFEINENLNAGVYFIKVIQGDNVKIIKVVKVNNVD